METRAANFFLDGCIASRTPPCRPTHRSQPPQTAGGKAEPATTAVGMQPNGPHPRAEAHVAFTAARILTGQGGGSPRLWLESTWRRWTWHVR